VPPVSGRRGPTRAGRRRTARSVWAGAWLWWLALGLAWGQAAEGPRFHFAQITDTHCGDSASFARTEKVLGRIAALPFELSFVAHTGDILMDNLKDQAVRERAAALLRTCRYPVYLTPGNHDLPAEPGWADLELYRPAFGDLLYCREVEGVRLVFFYSVGIAKGSPTAAALLDSVDRLVQEAGKPVLLFTHVPPVEDFYRNSLHPGWQADSARRWRDLVGRPEVRGVVCGHFHRDELAWIGAVPQFVASSVAGYWGRQGSFRVYEYRDGRLSYRTVYLE
jgi:3',5'-cyclic AMP phosphodiesterase CpdA